MASFFAGQSVICLGNVPGKVSCIRDSDSVVIVRPSKWQLANNKPPVFYMNAKDVIPAFKVGDMISCSFGKGEIKDIRTDGIYVVTLANWALATGKSPILYLQDSSITKYEAAAAVPELENKKGYVEECIEKATKYKNDANDLFKAGKFEDARSKYLEALGAMHYLHSDLTNPEKASVFELSVPCHNNIALCSLNLEKYSDCIAFSKNGLLLIQSLEDKINAGPSEVWKCLQARSVSYDKLQEWKRKSYFYLGKAELKNKEFDDAASHLEAAVALTPSSAKDLGKIKELLETAKKHRAAELKREKSTWSRAFKSSKAEHEAEEAAAAAAQTPPSSPTTRSSSGGGDGVTVSKGGGVHIDMNSILGKTGKTGKKADPVDAIAKKDDTVFNMIFGLGFLGVVGGLFWMFRARLWRR